MAKFDQAGLLTLSEFHKAAPTPECVHDATKENEEKAGVDDVHGHLRDAIAFGKEREMVALDHAFRFESQFVQ